MRIKNQEVIDKEEQIRSLLAANRTKINHLLATRGKGSCCTPDRPFTSLWTQHVV